MKDKLKKTRNILLFTAAAMILTYTAVDIAIALVRPLDGTLAQLDATLTTEFFSFWRWVVTTGAGITIAKTLKGNTNSDDDDNGGGIV